jgi:PAS domain S-box-containing protein
MKLDTSYRWIFPLMMAVTIPLWFSSFPLKMPFDWDDVLFEGLYLGTAVVAFLFIMRLDIKVLEIGWGIFVYGLLIDFLDEFTKEPDLVSTDIEGLLTSAGLVLVAVGIYFSQKRLRNGLEKSRQAEEALKFEREKLRLLYDNHPDAVVVLDRHFRVVYANQQAEDIGGVSLSEIKGRKCHEAIIGSPSVCDGCMVEKVVREKKAKHRIKHEVTATGKENWLSQLWYPVFDMEGEVDSVVEIARDITDMKRAEGEIKKYTSQLEDVNRLKELFTDILRHDLANPIMVADMYLHTLMDDYAYPEIGPMLETIDESLEKAMDLIESAGKFSKLETIEEVEIGELDIKGVIEKVVENLASVAAEVGMEIENHVATSMPLMANYIIEEVFTNLISNAIKYAHEGRKILINAKDMADSWRIEITDFGEGIKDEDKEAIFERFQRKEKGAIRGTGLGLAIAKRIVELHGGRIWVEDNTIEYCDEQGRTRKKKQGSIFYVSLPKDRTSTTNEGKGRKGQ